MILVLDLIVKHHPLESHGLTSKSTILNIVVAWSIVHHFVHTALALVREKNLFNPSLRARNFLSVTKALGLVLDLDHSCNVLPLDLVKSTVVSHNVFT